MVNYIGDLDLQNSTKFKPSHLSWNLCIWWIPGR